MPIYTNSLVVTGGTYNSPIYTNRLGLIGYSNMTIDSDLRVQGDVYTDGRMDIGTTIHATFRLSSNTSFGGVNELTAASNVFQLDFASTNFVNMQTLPMAVASSNIYNSDSGVITVPSSGMYAIQLQGSFSNDSGYEGVPQNGVYFNLIDSPYPLARVSGNFGNGNIVSTTHMAFLEGGHRFVPTFFSSDSNATLVAADKETYVSLMIAATYTSNLT